MRERQRQIVREKDINIDTQRERGHIERTRDIVMRNEIAIR